MPQQPAQKTPAPNPTHVAVHPDLIWVHSGFIENCIAEPLMGWMRVVEPHERLRDEIEMPKAAAHAVIQAFALDDTDPRLSTAADILAHRWATGIRALSSYRSNVARLITQGSQFRVRFPGAGSTVLELCL